MANAFDDFDCIQLTRALDKLNRLDDLDQLIMAIDALGEKLDRVEQRLEKCMERLERLSVNTKPVVSKAKAGKIWPEKRNTQAG
jgi:hypothetical protein